jgi:hypothetical protein
LQELSQNCVLSHGWMDGWVDKYDR